VGARAETEAIGLDSAVATARVHAPALLAERGRQGAADADRSAATGALLPRIQASGSLTWLDDGRLGAVGPVPLYDQEALATLRARQVLFDWRAFSARRSAGRSADAADAAVATAEAESVFAATAGWVRLAQAEELEKSSAAALARARAFEEMSAAFAGAGRGTKLDPLRARTARLEAERAALAAREAVPAAAARLGQVIGRPDAARLRTDGRWPTLPAPPTSGAAALERVRHSSPDLARLDALVAAARSNAAGARATWLPELAAVGTYGWRERTTPAFGSAPRADAGAGEWSAGVTAEWTLFEGGAGRASTARADARVAELEAIRSGLALQLEADVQEALGAWRSAAAGLDAARHGVAAATEARAASAALFAEGRATSLDVLAAEADLQRAEGAATGALGDLIVAHARAVRIGAAESP
jgi:OMF family outer membrane factor